MYSMEHSLLCATCIRALGEGPCMGQPAPPNDDGHVADCHAARLPCVPLLAPLQDTLLASALESFLVEPNMLCIDVVKLVHMYTMNTSTPAAAPTPQQPSPQDSEKKAEQQAGNGRSAFPANHGGRVMVLGAPCRCRRLHHASLTAHPCFRHHYA